MGRYNGAVVTGAGQALFAEAIAGGTPVLFTKMRTSSTVIPDGTNLESLTSLSGIEQAEDITSSVIYASDVIQVSANIPNTSIATAYYVQAVGVYAQLEGGSETLVAVCTAITPDEMAVYDPDSPESIIFKLQLRYTNATSITLTVNNTGTASVADLAMKVDKSAIVNDLTETEAGHVLDARQGAVLDGKITDLGSTGMHNPNLGYIYLSYDNLSDIVAFARTLINGRTYTATFNVNTCRVLFGAEFVASGVAAKTSGSGIFRFFVASATGGATNRTYAGAIDLANQTVTINTFVSEAWVKANYAPIIKYGIAASASKELEVVSNSYIKIETFSGDTSKMKTVHVMVDSGGYGHVREIGGASNVTVTVEGQWVDSETHLMGATIKITNTTTGHSLGAVLTIYSGGLNG